MKKADKYKELFSKEYLMGPNSMRLLEEMLNKYPLERGMRVLDLGCGKGLTSLFLAKKLMQLFLQQIYGLVQQRTILVLMNGVFQKM